MSVQRAALRPERPRGRVSSALFKAFLFLSMGVGIATLGALLVQVIAKGYKYVDVVLLLEPPSADPQIAGARPAKPVRHRCLSPGAPMSTMKPTA